MENDERNLITPFLFARLRVPTVSMNQKVHNISVALESLKASPAGLPASGGNITAKDIVQGHREKTLELVWHLIFGFGQAKVLDEASLENELAFLRKSLAYRVQIKDPGAIAGQVWTKKLELFLSAFYKAGQGWVMSIIILTSDSSNHPR